MIYETFAHERLVKLACGALTDTELAEAYTAISKDDNLKRIAGMYLVGSSQRATQNLTSLDNALTNKFLSEVIF